MLYRFSKKWDTAVIFVAGVSGMEGMTRPFSGGSTSFLGQWGKVPPLSELNCAYHVSGSGGFNGNFLQFVFSGDLGSSRCFPMMMMMMMTTVTMWW